MSQLLIKTLFPALSELQIEQFSQLPKLYESWNNKINVISRKDIDQLTVRHILHSLSISLFYDLDKNQKILDIGTGGGFPGIPLAILNPTSNFILIDSIGKKIKVVNEISKELGLKNCEGIHQNAKLHVGKYDLVVSRAVTAFDPFLEYTLPLLKPKGSILYLKGGDLSEELKNVSNNVTLHALSDKLNDPFFETKKLVHYRR